RFVEVIIDEVQDCSADDILVIDLLYEFGVTIVAVGDPDQSIYGFRSDAPAGIATFLGKLTTGERLNGNFRSSPAICAAIDSLRAGSERDDPIGHHVEVESPVILLSYRRRQSLPQLFASVIDAHDISHNDLIVLAHSAEHARVAAGAPGSGAD